MSYNLSEYASMLAQQARRFQEQQAAQAFGSVFGGHDIAQASSAEIGRALGIGQGIAGFSGENNMSTPGMSHLGTVKEFRNRFKEYTKAEFREMGNKPVIKEILSGMTKLNKEEIKDRIAEHLAVV